MFGVSTAIILDTRIKRKDGTYAVKLRLIYQRIPKYYPLGIHLTKDEWKKVHGEKPQKDYKDHKLYFSKIEAKAIAVIKTLDPFSFESFAKSFNNKTDLKKDVFDLFDEYIKELKDKGQIGTADSYTYAKGSFKTYIESKKRKRLSFGDVTPEWLQKYEDWMLSKDNAKSITTVGIYCRCLRRIINNAIEEGIFNRDFYPFGKRKYQIPAAKNIKKALELADIKQIVDYKPKTKGQEKARDMFLFSYLCNGANFKDIANLRFKNVDNDTITFIREKTKRTTKNNQLPVLVNLTPEIIQLIRKWSVKTRNPNDYVFGVYKLKDDELHKASKLHETRKRINKNLKVIGEELNLPITLTHGVARYCWATVMKRTGAPDGFISEGLGHQSLDTTRHYLSSFDDETRAKYQNNLLKF